MSVEMGEAPVPLHPTPTRLRRPAMKMEPICDCEDRCCCCCSIKQGVKCYTIFMIVMAVIQLLIYSTMFFGYRGFIDWIKTKSQMICDNSEKSINDDDEEAYDNCNDRAYYAAVTLFILSLVEMVMCIGIYYFSSRNLNIDVIYAWLIVCGLPAVGIPLTQIVLCILTAWCRYSYTGIFLPVFSFIHLIFKVSGIKVVIKFLGRVRKDKDQERQSNLVTSRSNDNNHPDRNN